MSLGRSAARGGAVMLTGQIVRIAVQALSVVVLSRLLSPRDFGLVGMVMAVVAAAEIFRDMGLSTAAIQAKELSRAQRDNLFWLNTAIGVLLAGIAFAAAPLIARVFDEQELVPMTRALAPMFVLSGMSTQYRADLIRRMQFGRLTLADVSAPVVGLGVAVVLATGGAGYWALVLQLLAQYATILVVVVVAAGWLPGRPRRGVPMASFLRFGWTLLGTQLVNYAASNADSLVIGTRLGAFQLGLYNRAYQLVMNPISQLRGPVSSIGVSLLARVQDDDARAQRYVEWGQVALGGTIVVGLGVLSGAAQPFSALLLGPQWDVSTIVSLLAAAAAFQTLALVGYWVYIAQALTSRLFRYSMLSAVIKICCILIGSHWGAVGVAAGFAAAPAISWPLSFWWLSRCAPLDVRPLLIGGVRMLALAASVGLAARGGAIAADGSSPIVGVGVATACAVVAYGVLVLVVGPWRRDALIVLAAIRLALQGTSRTAAEPVPVRS